MDAADPGWRRLGALLVDAGLVSEHDLVEALAEQHGSFLRTEHGFGTGLRALMGRDSVQESGGTPPEAPPLSPTEPPELSLGDTQAAAVDKSASAKRVEAEPAVSEGPERSVAWTAGPPSAAAAQASWSEQRREGSPEAQGQPRPDLGHLLFVPTYQGYLLLQRSGTAPALGEVLELPDSPGVRLVVAKLALSPLPQDRRVCAYLNNL